MVVFADRFAGDRLVGSRVIEIRLCKTSKNVRRDLVAEIAEILPRLLFTFGTENHMAKAHPGFKAVQSKIAKSQGVSKERAGAMLASKTREAGKAAKKANPRLKKVRG